MTNGVDVSIFPGWEEAMARNLKRLKGSAVLNEVNLSRVLAAIEGRQLALEFNIVGGIIFEPPAHDENIEEWSKHGRRDDVPPRYSGVKFTAVGQAYIHDLKLTQIRELTVVGRLRPGEFSFVGDCADCVRGGRGYCAFHDYFAKYRISVTAEGATYELLPLHH